MDFDFSLRLRQRKWDTLGCHGNADEYNFPSSFICFHSLSFLFLSLCAAFFLQQLTLVSSSLLFGSYQVLISSLLTVCLPFITFPHPFIVHRSFLLSHTPLLSLAKEQQHVTCHSVCFMGHGLPKQLYYFCFRIVTVAYIMCWSRCGFGWNCHVSKFVFVAVYMCVCVAAVVVSQIELIPGMVGGKWEKKYKDRSRVKAGAFFGSELKMLWSVWGQTCGKAVLCIHTFTH